MTKPRIRKSRTSGLWVVAINGDFHEQYVRGYRNIFQCTSWRAALRVALV